MFDTVYFKSVRVVDVHLGADGVPERYRLSIAEFEDERVVRTQEYDVPSKYIFWWRNLATKIQGFAEHALVKDEVYAIDILRRDARTLGLVKDRVTGVDDNE